MISQKTIRNILNKDEIKVNFIGNLDLSNGSDRIFCNTFSKFLNKQLNCQSEIKECFQENSECDIAIFKKDYSFKKLKQLCKKERNYLIGIINPSDKKDGLKIIKIADFAIVGSIEEKAYYSKYLKCFVYPLIEEVNNKYIKSYFKRPKNEICYHGNKQHLDYIDINLEKALIKLIKDGYNFKAIYNYKKLGKCKKKFITNHIQWDKDSWLEEISNSTVGICPSTHYSGFLRNNITKLIARKRILKNDYVLQYKNTSNASRAFIFHQLKIPVVAEIGGSIHHLLGDETAGFICYSERSWYESITRLCSDEKLYKDFAEKSYILINNLYSPDKWCERFIKEIRYWLSNNY